MRLRTIYRLFTIMDQSTRNVRRASWFNIITECQQRPVNVSVKQWLADNRIKEKAYYYWLRKFRREACGQIQRVYEKSL